MRVFALNLTVNNSQISDMLGKVSIHMLLIICVKRLNLILNEPSQRKTKARDRAEEHFKKL